MTPPAPPPEAVLIRLVREAAGVKLPKAAKDAGISKARWSQIETGYEKREGGYREVRARPVTLAHMAHAIGLPPQRLEAVAQEYGSREERQRIGQAGEILREILRDPQPTALPHDGLPPSGPDRELQLIQDTLDELAERIRQLQERGELRFTTSAAPRRRPA